ncbi:type II toxin-antitoxin system VapB family antitoxin [Xylanimonas protaetiae]|uniref:Antitoxin n=1 Tax=Xylanimonas protaetiae TaxID=2509457 RepID=A0A4P6F3H1_9MICO|nr:type II toxin-antitoxin system VapB family antitoxin [Xylanimonas protaetiae]QAY69846.1 antitoxin [Xylanimonas protaetiae]
MSLNIKNERTHALVRELAERTGLSQTSAVEEAVVRYLRELTAKDADQTEADRVAARRARIDLVRAQIAATVHVPLHVRQEADEALYDENGLLR